MRSDGTSLYATRFVSYVKVIPIRMCVWLHGLCSRIKAKTIFLSSKLLPSPSSKSFILITQNIFIGFLFIASYNSWKGLILSEVIENCSQLVKHHRIFTAEYIVLHTLKLRYLIIPLNILQLHIGRKCIPGGIHYILAQWCPHSVKTILYALKYQSSFWLWWNKPREKYAMSLIFISPVSVTDPCGKEQSLLSELRTEFIKLTIPETKLLERRR